MQTSGKKACFQLPECSLGYAKLMQTSGKKACFQLPECSLGYAKVSISFQNALFLCPWGFMTQKPMMAMVVSISDKGMANHIPTLPRHSGRR